MLIFILAYLGGVLTILSPCVLPVIPFVFAKSDQPFRKSGLPMLVGMGLSFATFAALSVVGGHWVIQANQIGRGLALITFTIIGVSLILPGIAERLTRPLVQLGNILQKRADKNKNLGSSLLLGAAIGLLWAPCAGPILGLVLAGAALGSSTQKTFGLLLAFAAGAATSLSLAIFAGGKVLATLKKGAVAEEWIKRTLGVITLCTVFAITFGLDTKLLARFSFINTNGLEQALLDRAYQPSTPPPLTDEGPALSLDGATQWLNSEPLNLTSLQGKVLLIDFWTYSCINCLRTLPYLKAWAEKYRDQGLVVIGVHSPEFAFEKSIDNVKEAVKDLNIHYPVAIDSNLTIWTAFRNQYWPAHYFVDIHGRIRFHHFGEGNYTESEKIIQELLSEIPGNQTRSQQMPAPSKTHSIGLGVEAPPSRNSIGSPETYLGYSRQEGFTSTPEIQKERPANYQLPGHLSLNQWGLSGTWKIEPEMAQLISSNGKLRFRFRARDLHLVIGAPAGKTIPFQVTIDGKPPGQNHGEDIDSNGNGKVRAHRLYQLIRQTTQINPTEGDPTFQIEFLEPGAEVYAFTFG